mmetsp:Transcript_82138/g.129371  ORF Transcript_82138/g.129371 Transcript_82138/m.129371 type:complete len:212 (-) Transcript_82138:54-689(-)|eukprot:CAMPEP_0169134826 /NCGR_PEP_ID=MMETSP1015-20121227/40106_1 /TAXON_ID=342587 /ORGANISM="Karlodinium micrum, Strain CCMP2283" /LENGTH=211 /DNA_ID=CAMNT_0009199417 /DNA_START=59 /DNA_END=694 /DNA_ORIENTATION=+
MFNLSANALAMYPHLYQMDSNALPHLLGGHPSYMHAFGHIGQEKPYDQMQIAGFGLCDKGIVADKKPSSSAGSKLHGTGKCRPCAWFWKPGGCRNGADCCHCHLCPEDEIKNRKKAKHAAISRGMDWVSPPRVNAVDQEQDLQANIKAAREAAKEIAKFSDKSKIHSDEQIVGKRKDEVLSAVPQMRVGCSNYPEQCGLPLHRFSLSPYPC